MCAASTVSNDSLVRLVLERGANVNLTSRKVRLTEEHMHLATNFLLQSWGALHFACANGHVPTIEVLLQFGANIDQTAVSILAVQILFECVQQEDLETPLHRALTGGNIRAVALLLQNGANPNKTRSTGDTPLDMSCGMGHTVLTDLLVRHGADICQLYRAEKVNRRCYNNERCFLMFVIQLGKSLLHFPCVLQSADLLEFVLATNKLDINLLDQVDA